MRLKLGIPLPDALFRFFNISSRNGYAPDLTESVQPVVVVADVSAQPAATASAIQYVGRSEPSAVAGNFVLAQLFNPVGSGVDVFLDSLLFVNNNASSCLYVVHHWNVALANLFSTWHTTEPDAAGTSWATGALEQRTETQAAPTPNHPHFTVALPVGGSQYITPPQPFRLAPGNGIVAFGSLVNQAVNLYGFGHQVSR